LILRTGIDMIEIARLEEIRPRIKTRFLKRVFTPLELAECEGQSVSLSGRFAAKEAVAKALGCGIGPIGWQEIEIQRGSNGEPRLQLYGKAQTFAQSLGLDTWSVSISHCKEYAIAVAVALSQVESRVLD
jgi:holo-[acyl-carrier protein] synthase